MKVFVAVILALGSVSALGSGPYLPSGWRPQGPAFYLPNEQKPADEPLKEVILETVAAGSDSLREYGPPKVQETVANQGLPDVATEQTFYVAEEKANIQENVEAEVEQTSEVQEEVTESAAEDATVSLEATVQEVELPEVSTASYVEVLETTVADAEEKLEQVVVEEEKIVEEAKSIVEQVANLENEVQVEQVQTVEAVAELKANQEGSGSPVPEGFLEYGPPGFKEYGPPKQDQLLLRSAVVNDESNAFEYTNEARRRRFSPKFRPSKNLRSKRVPKRH